MTELGISTGVGVVLKQNINKRKQPAAYDSRTLLDTEKNFTVMEK